LLLLLLLWLPPAILASGQSGLAGCSAFAGLSRSAVMTAPSEFNRVGSLARAFQASPHDPAAAARTRAADALFERIGRPGL
jgi:hypothetical protein